MTNRKSSTLRLLSSTALIRSRIFHAVIALGLTQIICWGTTLYALGVLAEPIIKDTGWSRSTVFGGLTLSLLISAIVSPLIGRMIDRHGAQRVMSFGTILMAAGLVWLANAGSQLSYLGAWGLLGPAMRMTLYDAAFAALVQIAPGHGRRAISYLTLFGGFASTIFWPIAHALNSATDWRTTLLVFAALNLALCLPLHWWGLAGAARADTVEEDTSDAAKITSQAKWPPLHETHKARAMILFGIVLFASGIVLGTMAVHMVNLLAAGGLAMGSAVLIASFKGVAQVAGRIGDILFARHMNPLHLGRISIGLLALAFILPLIGGASFQAAMIFTIILGIGQGIFTIVRGTVPLILFGAKGYGEMLGVLAVPYWLANALAPALFALIIDNWGYEVGVYVLFALALLALIAMQTLIMWAARRSDRHAGPVVK